MKFIIDNWMIILVALASGGMLAWPVLRGVKSGTLSPDGAVQLINRERAVVVDVRPADEFAAGHVTNARNVPLADLETRLPTTVKNKGLPVVLVCQTGSQSNRAVATARKLGYEQAQALAGGVNAWTGANLPLVKG